MCDINLRDVFFFNARSVAAVPLLGICIFLPLKMGWMSRSPFCLYWHSVSQGRGLREKGSYSMASSGSLVITFGYHSSGVIGLLHYSLSRVKVNATYLTAVIVCMDGAWYCFVPLGWSKQLFYKTFLMCCVPPFLILLLEKAGICWKFFLVWTNWWKDI